MHLSIDELLAYTDEERVKWRRWFEANGDEHLKIALAGEAHTSLGALILHCSGPRCGTRAGCRARS